MRRLIRTLDIIYASVLAVLLLPIMFGLALVIWIRDGYPVLYRSERMRDMERSFNLLKFRTMRPVANDTGVSGGDKSDRISATGAFLRRYRLDELPQLWNILRGDISFVGPRPPLRRYVEMHPELYREVLREKPGVTGLASLIFHEAEENLLRHSRSAEETERIYCRRCIPRKARLDRLYAKRRTPCTDMRVMLATVFRGISMHDRRK